MKRHGVKKDKSQAKATTFLVLFMFLIPTALALGYSGSLTGQAAGENAVEPASPAGQNDFQAQEALQTEPLETPTQQENPCESVSCADSSLACPDGFSSSCQNTCDPLTGQCGSCLPDCTGHEAGEGTGKEGNQTQQTEQPEPTSATNCTASWNCSTWSECAAGSQARLCTDVNGCGTDESKPEESMVCETAKPHNETNETCTGCGLINETINQTGCKTSEGCSDGNACTSDTCLNSTCQNTAITPCCGNGLCEEGEASETCPADCKEEKQPEPVLSITISSQDRITRGISTEISAVIRNTGSGTATSVRPRWILPSGIELLATDHDCGTLLPGSYCTATARVYAKLDTKGMKEIRVLVDYA